MRAKIEKQLALKEKEFEKLEALRKGKLEERKQLDRQLSEVGEELIRLQGDYRSLKGLLEEPEEKKAKKK